ncbi:MAG: hypothetical protein JST90_08105 [Bacteroidetes bacterium]|nr:hypothetical protein [Bacteroidota bacterium]
MKKSLPVAALIVCMSCAFVWQAAPKEQSTPGPKTFGGKEDMIWHIAGSRQAARSTEEVLLQSPAHALPFVLEDTDMEQPLHKTITEEDGAISSKVYAEHGAFSREPMRKYEFVAHLKCAGKDLIVYRMATNYSDDPYPRYYMVASMDSTHRIRDVADVAELGSPLSLTTCSITADGLITSTEYKQVWQNDPLKAGYKDNKVIAKKLVQTTYRRVTSDGRIGKTYY